MTPPKPGDRIVVRQTVRGHVVNYPALVVDVLDLDALGTCPVVTYREPTSGQVRRVWVEMDDVVQVSA